MLTPELRVIHQVEQVMIATHEVLNLGRDGEVEIRLVVRVAGKLIDLGDFVQDGTLGLGPFEERIDKFLGQDWKFPPDLGSIQNLSDFGEDVATEEESEPVTVDKSKAGGRRIDSTRGRLKKEHAVEDRLGGHADDVFPRRLSALASSRASLRTVSRSASVMPLSS